MSKYKILTAPHTLLLLLAFVLVAIGCKDPEPDPLDYDRTLLLQNIGKNYIVPTYNHAHSQSEVLALAGSDLNTNGDLASLQAAQTALKEARLAWLQCSPFEFGPAAGVSLRGALNTFPTDSSQIEANIAAGTWDLNQAANVDARGFPALDYLLHHTDDVSIVTEFTIATNAAARQQMLTDLLSSITTHLNVAASDWQPGDGNYIASFTSNPGTDAGSSTALFVNQFNFDLEQLKNARIGIPLGKKSLDVALPEKVESRYGAYSAELAVRHLEALQAIYEGQSFAVNGPVVDGYGLFEALEALEAKYNGQPLATAIRAQFTATTAALAAVPDPLQDAVLNNKAPVEAAYTELQRLIVLLKTDLPSAMGILITYTDNDGD